MRGARVSKSVLRPANAARKQPSGDWQMLVPTVLRDIFIIVENINLKFLMKQVVPGGIASEANDGWREEDGLRWETWGK